MMRIKQIIKMQHFMLDTEGRGYALNMGLHGMARPYELTYPQPFGCHQ